MQDKNRPPPNPYIPGPGRREQANVNPPPTSARPPAPPAPPAKKN